MAADRVCNLIIISMSGVACGTRICVLTRIAVQVCYVDSVASLVQVCYVAVIQARCDATIMALSDGERTSGRNDECE